MNKPIEILGGAFTCELIKGKWISTPNLDKVGKKTPKKESGKEVPQFPVIVEYESSSVENYKRTLKNTVVEIINFLKEIK